MLRILKYFALFLLISMHGSSFAAVLNVTSPTDRSITQSIKLAVNGAAPTAKLVTINGTKIDLETGGRFEAVAHLKPGKNVIEIIAQYPGGITLTRKIRILRIVTFDDIESLYQGRSHWAKPQILTLSTLGIIEGYPDNMFQPESPISRGELATWIARSKNMKVSKPKEDVFYDVPKEHWRAPYIKAIDESGIMSGLTKDRFGIDEKIQRSEAMEIFARAYNLSASTGEGRTPFKDVAAASEDLNSIYSAYKQGLVIGVVEKNRIFQPDRNIERAEVAMIISRLPIIKVLKAQLYDFSQGYTSARYSMIGTKPVIKKASVIPPKLAADGRTLIIISAEVADAQGTSDISQVWADITSLKGPNNAKMAIMDNRYYELSFVVTSEVAIGVHDITIKVLDKSGLKGSRVVKLTITGEKK